MNQKSKKLSPTLIVTIIVALGSLALFLALSFLFSNREPSEREREAEASNASIEQGNREREAYPLLKYLPINNAVYHIGYQFEEDGTPTLIIDTTEYYVPYALEKLNSLGDTSGYKIKIIDTTTNQ
ncbi:hypothetical protein IJ090_00570 [Candidatus Saccharibacteria bacterium]|nr:hypothetical protein [Candidatus Saccharibacteria bacterium]